jgi:hypothetical protein
MLIGSRTCELPYRGLTFAVAEAWLSLARQQEAINELLVIWSKANSPTSTVLNRQSFILSTFTGPPPAARLAVTYATVQRASNVRRLVMPSKNEG